MQDELICSLLWEGRFYMKKQNFYLILCNMKEIYKYDPPYDGLLS